MKLWSRLDSFERTNLTLSAGVIGASLIWSPPITLGVIVGVLIEAINFRGLRSSADWLFGGSIASGAAVGLFAMRFLFLGAATAVAIWAGVHPLGLVLGLSTIVPAVVITAWMNRSLMSEVGALEAALPPDDPSWDRWDAWCACERPEPDEWDSGDHEEKV